jgi:hypothetical protein
MRLILLLSLLLPASAQTGSGAWKVIKDSKEACQISVPADWTPLSPTGGAAVFHDATTAIAVVTSQTGQIFKPLTESQLKTLGVPRDRMFDNTASRLFYQDKTSRNAEDPNAYSAMVPGKGGTCSCRVVFVPSIGEDLARKIALSLGPNKEEKTPN